MWTAIVPAAGEGSRLVGCPEGGKMFYSIVEPDGYLRPVYDYWMQLLLLFCDQIVVVKRPGALLAGADFNNRKVIAITQHEPHGTLEAVAIAMPFVRNEQVVVLWGDKVTVTPKTLELTMRRCTDTCRGVVPTAPQNSEPYTEVVRTSEGYVQRILQASAGHVMRARTESDIGLFAFPRFQLQRGIELAMNKDHTDFLRVVEYVNCSAYPIATPLESVSVNTLADVERIEHEWRRLQQA